MNTRTLLRLLLIALSMATTVHAQGVARLVEEVAVSEQPGSVTVTVMFTCGVRYLSHTPASQGDALRVRLYPGADCGKALGASSVPPALDARGVIRAIDVDQSTSTGIELGIRWAQVEKFTLVPAFDGRGLRIQLIRPKKDRANVIVREVATSTYAVNLYSSREPFTEVDIAAASRTTGVKTYVSETVVDGDKWYRLRAGPFAAEEDARRVLASARSRYPKAWLAVADDATLNAVGAPGAIRSATVAQSSGNATMMSADIESAMNQARDAFRAKDYPTAIALLTKLLEQPEFPERSAAQELLGLARERSGQLAHAKAEYEEYLSRYPQGDAADRVRKRLRALTFAASPASGKQGESSSGSKWKVYGGASQVYRRDASSFDNGAVSTESTTQDAILTDLGLAARRTGERFDFATRVSAGYAYDLLPDGPGNQLRVTQMYAELHDKQLEWTVRGGRQAGSAGGLIGTYDGLYAGYQLYPHLRLNAHAGLPVESSRSGPSTDRRFYALSADLGTFAGAWDTSLYAVSQSYFDATDRQALGAEVRYFRPGRTLVALVDYDIHYRDLNDLLLLGTLELPKRWTANGSFERRKSPSLATRNAITGQPVTRFDQLFGLYSIDEIEQLARDRTADSTLYTLSLSRPFGQRWHWSLDFSDLSVGGTPASGGVEAVPAMGSTFVVSTQALGYGLFRPGDVSSLGLQYQAGEDSDALSLGLNAQFPFGQSWRIGPRLRIDQRWFHFDGSDQISYAPGLRTDVRWQRVSFEFEGGAEFAQRSIDDASSDTARYYLSIGYRYDF